MGDRANVRVVDGDSTVFLYTHDEGTELPQIVQRALLRGEDRWSDGAYLARIIFSEMTRDSVEGLTGFGISSVVGDGENRIVEVFVGSETIMLTGEAYAVSFKKYVEPDYVPAWK